MRDIIGRIPYAAKYAIAFCGGAAAGVFVTVTYMKRGLRSPSKEFLERWEYADDEETVGDTALNSGKPDIFSVDGEEGDEPTVVAVKVSKYPGEIIDMKAYQLVPEEKRHVCTYFVEDEILAGYDDDLDIIEPMAAYGGIPEEALEMLKYNASGIYVMCADHETALEIVGSHGNYLEEYNSLEKEE